MFFASSITTMSSCPLTSDVHAATSPDPPMLNDACVKIAITAPPPELHKPSAAQPPAPVPDAVDYMARAQWLRAAVLGANDGLVSVASLMMGVGALNRDARAMFASGLAGLVAGACSMAIGEFVSVQAQYDIQVAEMERRGRDDGSEEEGLPSPIRAAGASALAFALGAALPLLAGVFIGEWGVRMGVVCAVSSVGLAGFGAAGAAMGGAHVGKGALRVLIGGWIAMLLTFGVLRAFGLIFKMQISSA